MIIQDNVYRLKPTQYFWPCLISLTESELQGYKGSNYQRHQFTPLT